MFDAPCKTGRVGKRISEELGMGMYMIKINCMTNLKTIIKIKLLYCDRLLKCSLIKKIFGNYISEKWLVSKISREALKCSNKKLNLSTKYVKDLNNPIKEKLTDDKQSNEKLLTIMPLGRTAVTYHYEDLRMPKIQNEMTLNGGNHGNSPFLASQ